MGNNIQKLTEVIKSLTKTEIEVLEKTLGEFKKSMEKVELSTLNPGETFKIGEHNFIVLEQTDGQTKVISKAFMAKNIQFDRNTRDYNKSNIKKLIEEDIQPLIEKEVGAENLVEHIVNLTSVDMQNEFNPCRCKVRLITFDEGREYNDLLVNEDWDDWWWTLTPWSTEERGWSSSITVVSSSGGFLRDGCSLSRGVRPFCIFSSSIFESEE